MKRFAALVLALCFLVVAGGGPALAVDAPEIRVEDRRLVLPVSPVLQDGQLFVPVRGYFEARGGTVSWDPETRSAWVQMPGRLIRIPQVPLGSTTDLLQREEGPDGEHVILGVATFLQEGRLFVPVRAAAWALQEQVHWDPVSRTVLIRSGKEAAVVTKEFRFALGDHGWTGDFTDLPADYEEDLYRLESGLVDRPSELGPGKAMMIGGSNASDDLFMYLRKQLTAADGIEPDTAYEVRFQVSFATNAPAGAVGIGGPPGEAVWVKVGASTEEPVPVVREEMGIPYIVLSVDKGSQNDDGENALRIGDVAKPENDDFVTYEIKTLDNSDQPLRVVSDNQGRLWLFVGTDSGFEGRTVLYYTDIAVQLRPVIN